MNSKNFDWKKTLGMVAPALATALGGPAAGMAIQIAASALGLGDNASEDDIAAAVASGNPETLVKLKQADADFKVRCKQLGVDLAKIDAEDRKDARAFGIATGTGTQIVLSIVFIIGYFFIFNLLFDAMTSDAKPDNTYVALLSALIGIMTASLQQIMNYWFGSSAGSAKKTNIMAAEVGK